MLSVHKFLIKDRGVLQEYEPCSGLCVFSMSFIMTYESVEPHVCMSVCLR